MYADEQALCDVAGLCRVFGDKTRVTVLYTLTAVGVAVIAILNAMRTLK